MTDASKESVRRTRQVLALPDERVPSERVLARFRALVAREPDHRLLRYCYALALQAAGLDHEARQQTRALSGLLRLDARDAVLEDGSTLAADVITAVRLIEHELG